MQRHQASARASEPGGDKGIQVSELLYFCFALRYRPPQTGAGILRVETVRPVSGLIDRAPQADKSGEGAPACRWLPATGGDARDRLHKYASSRMAELISRFKQTGVSTIRTAIDVDDHSPMSFLRSCGMTTGSFVALGTTMPAYE